MTDILISIGIPSAYAGDVALFLLMVLAGVTLMFIVKKTKIGAFAFAVYTSYCAQTWSENTIGNNSNNNSHYYNDYNVSIPKYTSNIITMAAKLIR